MNKHDRDNLKFIMSLDEEGFDKWCAAIDLDDVNYAIELLKQARLELDVKAAEVFDEILHTKDADAVLKKFML